MSAPLRDVALIYPMLNKLAYALFKEVNTFWHYILRSEVISIVPNLAVKNLLAQQEVGIQRGN